MASALLRCILALGLCHVPAVTAAQIQYNISRRYNAPPAVYNSAVAIGDSFSASPGAGNAYGNNDTCDRRTGAYPLQLEGTDSALVFASCVGTLTSNFGTQLDTISSATELVLVSIGENDVGLMPALTSCLILGSGCEEALSTFNASLFGDTTFFDEYNLLIDSIVEKLQWSSRPNHTMIYQTSYPQLFEDKTSACDTKSFFSPLLTTELRTDINTISQQLNFVLSYWIDYINYQNTRSPDAAYVIKFADQDERYTGHRFCQTNINEPAYENERIWFFHLGDRDEIQAAKLTQWVPASAYASINASLCSMNGVIYGGTDADVGSDLNCVIATYIAAGKASPFPRGLWPQISDGASGNSTAKTFRPTINGEAATAAELHQRLSYSLPSQGGQPSGRALRVVGVGDSITWGYTSTEGSGYRKFLYEILAGDPSNKVEFVGSVLSGTPGSPWERSEGYSGLTAGQILDTFDATEIKQANVILLMAGTNDVGRSTSDDLTSSLSDLWNLMNALLTVNPRAVLLVAHITPIGLNDFSWPPSALQMRVIQWNTQISMMINRLRLTGARILKVHTSVTVFHHVDTLHPTDTGYEILAFDWAERISDAQDLGWLAPANSVPPTKLKPCKTSPEWVSNGEIASGWGLGQDLYPSIICSASAQDPTQCECGNSDGSGTSYSTPLVGSNCADNGYDLIHAVHFADLDGDGRSEFLWVDEVGAVTAFYNQGPPNGEEAQTAAQVAWAPAGVIATGIGGKRQEIHFADLNGDGRADYIWVRPDGSTIIYVNGGQAEGSATPANVNWIPQGEIASGIGAPGSSIEFVDLTGNGRADYLSVGSTGEVIAYANDEFMENLVTDTAFVDWVPLGLITPNFGAYRNETVFADVNGLGRASYLVVARNGTDTVVEHKNDGGNATSFVIWQSPQTIFMGDGISGAHIMFADLNGDGRAELLEVDPETSAVIAYFNGCK